MEEDKAVSGGSLDLALSWKPRRSLYGIPTLTPSHVSADGEQGDWLCFLGSQLLWKEGLCGLCQSHSLNSPVPPPPPNIHWSLVEYGLLVKSYNQKSSCTDMEGSIGAPTRTRRLPAFHFTCISECPSFLYSYLDSCPFP